MAFPPLRSLNAASLLTSLGAAAGLSAVLLAVSGETLWAVSAVLVAIGCDHLDGPLARALEQSTPFGAELDSLADALSFCAAPALVSWSLGFRGPLEAFVLCGFVLAGLWRLARYNVVGLDESGASPVFVGLPTTNAAAWWVVLAALASTRGDPFAGHAPLWYVFFVGAAVSMVSSLRVPKRGWYVRVHLVAVPGAVLVAWLAR